MKRYAPFLLFLLVSWRAAHADEGRILSFTEAVDRAESASPQRAAAQADVDASIARRKEALSGLGPKVRADFSETRYDKEITVPFGSENALLRADNLREGSIAVLQPVSGLYTAYQQTAAAKSYEETSQLNLDIAKASASFQVADAYLQAQQAREQVEIAKSSLMATESQVKDAEALTQSGRLMRSDFLKIGIAQQDAKAQWARAKAEQKKSMDRLLYLVGLPSDAPVQLETLSRVQTADSFPSSDRSTALGNATEKRLELQRAAASVRSAEHSERLTQLKYIPTVDLFVKWQRIYSEPPFGNPPFTRSYGVAASWELWDNGARSFAHDEAAAETRKAQTALQESKDRVRLEIDDLLADLEAAREAFTAAEAAVEQAEEAYRLDKARFSNGLVTTTDLLLSEATATKAKGNRLSSVVHLDRLMLALQRATGSTKPQALN